MPLKFINQNETCDTRKFFPHLPNLKQEKQDFKEIFEEFVDHFPPHLRWVSFYQNGMNMAEVLMSVELEEIPSLNLSIKPVERNDAIPAEISPVMKKFRQVYDFFKNNLVAYTFSSFVT